MPDQLPKRYIKDYEILEDRVFLKNDYKFKSEKLKDEILIPKEHVIVTVTREKGTIKHLSNKISHAHILFLKEKHNIKFDKYDLIADPTLNNQGRGYVRVSLKGSDIVGDGEVVITSLPEDWQKYAFTMLYKRAEDRAISQYLGLYSEGFLTESEILPEGPKDDYDNLSLGQVKSSFGDKSENSENKVDSNDSNNDNSDWVDITLLLTTILKVETKDFTKDIKEVTGKEDLYDCTTDQQKDLAKFYEEQFTSDDHLRVTLIDYIKGYMETEKWSKHSLLIEVKEIIKGDPVISKLSIDECYDVVLKLGLYV